MAIAIKCRDCGIQFDPESPDHKPFGYINQCRDCSRDRTVRHVGIPGQVAGLSKMANPEIFRGDGARTARRWNTNRCGASLPFSSKSDPSDREDD